jgi:YVTN family beta-propeller protein
VAPLLKGTVNNVLDVDELGDADGTVQVIATDTSTFKVGDEVFIRIKGTPVEGPPIDWEPSAGVELNSVPSIMEIKAPNAVLRQLAKSQITLSYRLEKADGSADLKSKSQFIRAIGEVQRLAAPEVLDENSGALDPTLPQIRLEMPFDKSFVEGQVLQPAMLGTTPGRKPYLPELPTRPITHNDIVAAKPLLYNIDGKHLAPVDGGTAEFYYQLLIPSAVLTTLDAFEASRAIRESIHSDILRVGEPRQELPQPKVAGVVDDVLPADTAGTTATVIYKETVDGDEIFMSWLGSITGEYPDSIKLNEFTAGKEVPFTIPAAMIKGNEGGTVEVKYEIKRAAGGTSYSDTLKFSVGVALDLKEPKIKQTPNDSSLDPLNAQSALTAVINYDGMLVGDKIIVRWIGATGTLPTGSHTTDPWPVSTVGPQEIPLAVSVLAFNLDKSITLNYSVTRATQDPKDSRTLTLAVLQLRVDLSHSPKIIQAAGGGDGTELDVSTLTAAATLRGGFWPHIASGQRVWMEIQGTKKDDTEYKRVVWRGSGNAVNGTWISQGYLDASLPLADLQSLKDLSPLNVSFMATPDRSMDENLALSFPLRTYIVKAMEPYVLSFTDAIYTIAPAARLRDVRLQLRTAVDGIAVPNTPVCLTLPEGFRFADGSGQSRTFHTDLAGDINVSRIKGHANPGKYSLTARVNNFLAQASVDIRTPGTSGKIILNNSAVWLDMTPDGLELYVTIADTREVVIIDTQSLVIVETLKTDTYPCTVAISSDGAYAYLTNFDETSVDRFNVQTRSLVNRLNIEAVPHSHSVVFAPDNSRAYMTCRGSSAVAEIDMQSQTEINRISVGSCPNHIIINPSGDRLYVSNANSNTVSVIDRRDLSVIAEIPVNPAPYVLTMHPDRKRILVCSLLLPKVDIIDIEAFSVIGTITVQAYPYGTVVSPNGQRIYICNRGSTMISVVDASTLEVIDTLQVEAQPISLTFSPDGKLLFVCHHASNEVLVLEINQ